MRFSIFTQNTWLIPVRPFWPHVDLQVATRAERINDLVASFEYPDVLMLQEVWAPLGYLKWATSPLFARREISDFLSNQYTSISDEAGFDSFFNLYKFFDSGLLTASKFPILLADYRMFANSSFGEDRLASKGVLAHAFVIGNSECVVTLNTHLDAASDAVKFSQISDLLVFFSAFLRKIPSSFRVVLSVVAGDFNLDVRKFPRLKELMGAAGFRDAFQNFPDLATSQDGERIDYIWLRGDAEISSHAVTEDFHWRLPSKGDGEQPPAEASLSDLVRRATCATDHAGLAVTLDLLPSAPPDD